MLDKIKKTINSLKAWTQEVAMPWLTATLVPAWKAFASKAKKFFKHKVVPVIQLRVIRSLRIKIQIWQFALLIISTTILLIGFYYHEKELRYINLDTELAEPVFRLSQQFEAEKGKRGGGNAQNRQINLSDGYAPPALEEGNLPAIESNLAEKGFYVSVWNKKQTPVFKTANHPEALEPTFPDPPPEDLIHRWNRAHRESVNYDFTRGWIIIGVPQSLIEAELSALAWRLFLAGLSVAAIALIGGWFISGQAIKPIAVISQTAQSIAEGNLKDRIRSKDTDNELDQLAQVLNNTFNRLEVALNRQIQFTADASHELRTPLAIVLNECRWALKKKRDDEDYQTSFKTCLSTASHMGGLIESLLELARIDSGEARLEIDQEDIDRLVGETLSLMRPIASQKNIELVDESQPIVLKIDKDKIRQVLINLVSNAIQHSPNESKITIRINTSQSNCSIEVVDQGKGIEKKDIPHLFDRFYRSDNARKHDGGTGLGLAISKAIAVAHEGDLSVSSQEGVGSVFRLTLPLT
ncbi:MAG: HAMP domain-containing sensor histidine kinase [Verrucomicrobiota bacterium]